MQISHLPWVNTQPDASLSYELSEVTRGSFTSYERHTGAARAPRGAGRAPHRTPRFPGTLPPPPHPAAAPSRTLAQRSRSELMAAAARQRRRCAGRGEGGAASLISSSWTRSPARVPGEAAVLPEREGAGAGWREEVLGWAVGLWGPGSGWVGAGTVTIAAAVRGGAGGWRPSAAVRAAPRAPSAGRSSRALLLLAPPGRGSARLGGGVKAGGGGAAGGLRALVLSSSVFCASERWVQCEKCCVVQILLSECFAARVLARAGFSRAGFPVQLLPTW